MNNFMPKEQVQDLDEGFFTPPSNQITWGKPGDVFRGTYIGSRQVESKFGKGLTAVFDLIGEVGAYHAVDEDGKPVGDQIEVVNGQEYYVFSKNTFEDVIRKAKVGQRVLLRFVDFVKPKSGGKPYKLIQAKLGAMDPDYHISDVSQLNDISFV